MDPSHIKPLYSGPSPFSPRIDFDELGVKISVPKQIVFTPGSKNPHDEAFAYIPVSLAYRVPGGFPQRMWPEMETILYIAADTQRGVTYVGDGMPDRILIRTPPFDDRPDSGTSSPIISHSGWVTINLAQQAQLPARDATYWVHATFGSYVSNVVRVEVCERRGGAR